MLTLLLVLLIVIAAVGTVGITAWCFGQGFFFWIFIGSDVCKFCLYGIAGLFSLLSDSNS